MCCRPQRLERSLAFARSLQSAEQIAIAFYSQESAHFVNAGPLLT
ncbi:hypothetical protein BF49_2320 [Bradyrhizobium sp.]|nr:hypothetical protein BF49_2320 [Bradyrhizobium sp.]